MRSFWGDVQRRASALHLPTYGQWTLWVTLCVAGYTQLLVAHAMFVGVEFEGVVYTPTAVDHVYPTAVPLAGVERYRSISLLSFLPSEILHSPTLYTLGLAGYFLCATLWALQIWPRWSAPLAAGLYTATMALFWERGSFIAEWWNTVNVIVLIFAAWYFFHGHAISRALRAGTFWRTPLFPAWVHWLCMFAVAWFFTQAGWRKLLVSGWDWTDGTSLQLSVHWAQFKFGPTPFVAIQELVMQNRSLAHLLNVATIVIESTAFLSLVPLLFPRLIAVRWLYGLALVGFFLGVTTMFGTWYFESLFFMAAIILWPFDRWVPRLAEAFARREKVRVVTAASAWGRIKRALISRFDIAGRYELE